MAKAAVVGESDGILVFKAAGVDAFIAENERSARDIIKRIATDYAVIFITEELSEKLEEFLKRFDENVYPAILTLPSANGGGYAMEQLRRASERALGVDILFK